MSGAAGRFSESAPAVVTAKALAVVFIAPMLDDVLALAEAARKNVNDHAISLAQQPKIYHYPCFFCHRVSSVFLVFTPPERAGSFFHSLVPAQAALFLPDDAVKKAATVSCGGFFGSTGTHPA